VAKYPRMSAVLDKAEYTTYNNQRVMLNGRVVKVSLTSRSNRYGSWERGFKFTDTLVGYLTRRGYKKYPYNNRRAKWWQNMMLRSTGRVPVGRFVNEYSADHGKTWHTNRDDAVKCRGKVVIRRDTRTELAFEGIQQLCRREDPSYKWRP
jgi:hypothetical protein